MNATARRSAHRTWTQRAAATVTALLTMFASLVGLTVATTQPAFAASDSLGSDFWLGFMQNYSGGAELTLFITGPTATTGTVEIPGLTFSQAFTVTPGTVTSVPLPAAAEILASDTVGDLGIHVSAAAEVTVYGLSRIQFTTDAYLGLPTDILGTEYIMQGYEGTLGDELAVVATQNSTVVTFVPKTDTSGHPAGIPFDVTLNQGQTYQLVLAGSGTVITADKPISVYGGNQCANIPTNASYCDHVVEQMTPTVTWGKSFVTEPLATRTMGDTFRYMASENDTAVSVNGTVVATLDRGELFEEVLTAASTITSDKPILVTQYSNGTTFDDVVSDPFEVIVPPYEQFLNSYTVTTPETGFLTNFINVVAPTASIGSVTLDGTAIPASSFTAIAGSTFSGAQLPVELGSHTLGGSQPFGVTVYGFATDDSYGYPGGLSLAPVAAVTNLALTPETSTGAANTEYCATATVTDQNNVAVVGVRVDFTVTGVNPTSGFENTAANGTAEFCYTGAVAGDDSIEAAVGTVTDTVTRTWTAVVPTTHMLGVGIIGSGTVTSSPAAIDCPGTCSAEFADGASVGLTAVPADGFAFTGWSGACTGAGACSVTMSSDQSVTATFTATVPTHNLTVGVTGSGSVISDPAGINCPGTCNAGFAEGATVELTPTPADGFAFTGWSGACTGAGACSVTMSGDQAVTAAFTAIPVTHNLATNIVGSGSVVSEPAGIDCPGTCSADFAEGATVVLTPAPGEGFAFSGWSGACTGAGACSVTMSTDQAVTATFTAIVVGTLTVTETSDPPTVTAGNSVQQTFTVINSTGSDQTNVALAVTLPAGSTVLSSGPGQGTCTAGPATLTCSLGTIPANGTVTIPVVVRVPAGFPPGLFAPDATSASDQSASTPAGPLPGSQVVAVTAGQAFGFVPPGGTITTGPATPANPTGATFRLPNAGSGSPISLTTELTTPTYCGGQPCRGRLLTLSPFTGGYDNPRKAPVLDISLDKSQVKRFGPSYRVWVQKEDTTVAPVRVPDCRSTRYPGKYRWHHKWWKFKKGQRIANPSPCVSRRYIDRNGDSHVEILILQGDPKFGRR